VRGWVLRTCVLAGAVSVIVALGGVSASGTSRTSADLVSSFPRTAVRLEVPTANAKGAFTTARTLTVPRGWKVEVWALMPDARFMTWTPEGDLLVSEPYDDRVVELVPAANPAAPPTERLLLSGLTWPQGLAFDTLDGQTVLYVAESDEIDRYLWRGAAGIGARTVIVRDLPDLDPRGDEVNRLKTLVVGANHRIYVNIGSAFNASTRDVAGNPPRASVVSYAPDGGDMQVLATGVRNAEGLSFAPNGVLWGAVNGRDDIPYPFHRSYGGVADAYGKVIPSYADSHPPDAVVALTPGRDLGWPYCNPDTDKGLIDPRWDDDEQNNAGGKALDCSTLTPINVGLRAHSAPLGLNFLEHSKLPEALTGGALLAVHGSAERPPRQAPAVLWLPWSTASEALSSPVTLISGFQIPNGTRWGRPADAIPGPNGDLYISDDTAGAIYRLTP
jgi:glucose/arabinose dehydrogenase